MLPRTNRGIFAMNELPDLSPRIQVGLFNILEEGDVQIKGYPIRLSLDLLIAFTANPEDYTARGKIITPLKDRISAEVRTHYPPDVGVGMAITEQEAWTQRNGRPLEIPKFVREVVERMAFLARMEQRVDQRSGVSQRMPIAVMETLVSSAEQRAIRQNESEVVPRIGDVYAALPAMTGKMELEYEGELQGAGRIARELVSLAAGITLDNYRELARGHEEPDGTADDFDEDDDIEEDDSDVESIIEYFEGGGIMQVSEDGRGVGVRDRLRPDSGTAGAGRIDRPGARGSVRRTQDRRLRADPRRARLRPEDQPDPQRGLHAGERLSRLATAD